MVVPLLFGILFANVAALNLLAPPPEQTTPNPYFMYIQNTLPAEVQYNGGIKVVPHDHSNCPNSAMLLRILNILKGSLFQNGLNNLDKNKIMYVLQIIKNYFENSSQNVANEELSRVFSHLNNHVSNFVVSSNKNKLRESDQNIKDNIKMTVKYEFPASFNCNDSFQYLLKLIYDIYGKNISGLTNLNSISENPTSVYTYQIPEYEKIINDKLENNQLPSNILFNLLHNKGSNVENLQNYRPQPSVGEVKFEKIREDELHPSTAQHLPYNINFVHEKTSENQLQKSREDEYMQIWPGQSNVKYNSVSENPYSHIDPNIYPVQPNNEINTPKTNEENPILSNPLQTLIWNNQILKAPFNIPPTNPENLINHAQYPYVSNPNIYTPENLLNPIPPVLNLLSEYNSNIGQVKYSEDISSHIDPNIYPVQPNNEINTPKTNEEKPILSNPLQTLIWNNQIWKAPFNVPPTNPENLINHAQSPYASNPNMYTPENLSNPIPPVLNLLSEYNPNIGQVKYSEDISSNAVNIKNTDLLISADKYVPDTSNNMIQNNFALPLSNNNFMQPLQNPNNQNQNVPNVFGSPINNKNIQGPGIITASIVAIPTAPQNIYNLNTNSADKNQFELASFLLNLPNSQHLNSAANFLNLKQMSDRVVEITYVLQRPRAVQYEPLYLMKYRLPLQIFEEKLNTIILQRPYLINDPNQLYQELLAVMNIKQSLNQVPALKNNEILNMINTNTTYVGTKFLRSNESAIDDELKIIKDLNSNLTSEDVLNINNGTAERELERLKHDNPNIINKENETQRRYDPAFNYQGLNPIHPYPVDYSNNLMQSSENMNNMYKPMSLKKNTLHTIPSIDPYFKQNIVPRPQPLVNPSLNYMQ